ncbi:efflux RND transporter periplasmic adaptor subunit [Geofilum rubicundum]|uniref:Macrolide-specific efflux protein macA n=1 Tax=Geofilum rubicundum JCM 15548 TaxID=1236989 RepID=A0A0E9M2N8_9BACT|nr:HlyD family efflux transporter periplasmic adaptor subunit [Geofilum rubicundum]GAO31794.1 macrolide-specific efflux protein macA precursor [Geofilum rubicundum JCM 15548]
MKKNLWQIIIPIALVIVTLVIYSVSTRERAKEPDVVRVEKGTFEIVVKGMGELEALESTQIMIPEVLDDRSVRIRSIAINDLVREGTVVKKGDYVATLDPGEVEERMRSAEDDLEMFKNNLDNAKIDSSLVLSEVRDEIRQANDLVLDREIKLEQSVYESVAVQRQAQISLETAVRSLEQKERNYIQVQRRHHLYVRRAEEKLQEELEKLEMLQQLKKDLRVTAPGDGLVVYARGHNNEKVKVGSHVSRWNPMIATLPDLATLQSVVYVKEIDISKIEPGLQVRVGIDAFPEEEFRGVVTRVANVGQAVADEFHSAFKVEIKVDSNGKVLLPGMTSTNNIVVESVKEALMVPRLAVFSNESMTSYVYKREGISGVVQQQINTAGENDSFYWVEEGLEAGDRVMMHPPKNTEKLSAHFLE